VDKLEAACATIVLQVQSLREGLTRKEFLWAQANAKGAWVDKDRLINNFVQLRVPVEPIAGLWTPLLVGGDVLLAHDSLPITVRVEDRLNLVSASALDKILKENKLVSAAASVDPELVLVICDEVYAAPAHPVHFVCILVDNSERELSAREDMCQLTDGTTTGFDVSTLREGREDLAVATLQCAVRNARLHLLSTWQFNPALSVAESVSDDSLDARIAVSMRAIRHQKSLPIPLR
jgi:hypothetical protein